MHNSDELLGQTSKQREEEANCYRIGKDFKNFITNFDALKNCFDRQEPEVQIDNPLFEIQILNKDLQKLA